MGWHSAPWLQIPVLSLYVRLPNFVFAFFATHNVKSISQTRLTFSTLYTLARASTSISMTWRVSYLRRQKCRLVRCCPLSDNEDHVWSSKKGVQDARLDSGVDDAIATQNACRRPSQQAKSTVFVCRVWRKDLHETQWSRYTASRFQLCVFHHCRICCRAHFSALAKRAVKYATEIRDLDCVKAKLCVCVLRFIGSSILSSYFTSGHPLLSLITNTHDRSNELRRRLRLAWLRGTVERRHVHFPSI